MSGSVGRRRAATATGRRRAVGLAAALAAAALAPIGAVAVEAQAAAPVTSAYDAVGPVRLADTRADDCGCERLDDRTISVPVIGRDGVSDDAVAASVTLTALRGTRPSFATAYPGGSDRPATSTVNVRTDRVVANSAIIPLGADGAIEVFTELPTDVVVDLTGVFVPAAIATAGRFVPVAPRRLVDTRLAGPIEGWVDGRGAGRIDGAPLPPGGRLTLTRPAEVAAGASAVVVNVTSVAGPRPGYVSVRPAGGAVTATPTSALNTNGSGQAVAGSVIVPISPDGVVVETSGGGHLVVDLLGWFTGADAEAAGTGLFVPMAPTRLLDTRREGPRLWPDGTRELASPVSGAGSLVTNVTVTRPDRRGYVVAYPAGTAPPDTSTVNPAMLDHVVANLAISGLSERGVAYRSRGGTDLVVDLTGYFTGTPVTATERPAPNERRRQTVLMVGDSTLATLNLWTASHAAFVGFSPVVNADNCRRLVRPSCRSPVTQRVPDTVLEAIRNHPAAVDVLVVRAGYNDWGPGFPSEFDAVVRAARAKGAHTIVWMTYTAAWSPYDGALAAYRSHNADLFAMAATPQYADVVIADLDAYTRTAAPDWTWDGVHLTEYGTWLITDFISRWVAAIEHRPCPAPWGPGGPTYDPCPKPESIGAVPNPAALY